jgi:hypothetical protein
MHQDLCERDAELRHGLFPLRSELSTVPATVSLAFDFLERLARVSEGIDSGRDAAIDGNLKQYLLDLVLREPVLQGSFDVQLQYRP